MAAGKAGGGPLAAPVPQVAGPVGALVSEGGQGGPQPALRIGDLPGSGVGPADKVVALTFDDGPDPSFTPRVLDVLSHYQVPATFFMIGWEAAASPDLVKRVAARGDGVGSHTWNHIDLTRLSDAGMAVQVDKTQALLSSETGWKVACIRPPQGHVNPGLVRRLSQRGLITVLWSADTRDWTLPGTDTIVRRALADLSPGAIILMHDGGGDRRQTLAALPRIIESVHARGYRLVPICR
ncbi:MAG: peptidoglycan-N-acetylglucosamine deacetylase [Actinomycetota bacterium]|nr:peptidoglycan-N-acetylglucosamine deacetylase [Actinomycetota bacterium]